MGEDFGARAERVKGAGGVVALGIKAVDVIRALSLQSSIESEEP
jgi:hypothetical protein